MRKQKGNAKRIMSGFMAVLTVLSTMMQPVTTFAAEASTDGKIPLYKDVADLLDADEVVVAHDHEVSVGSSFDIKADFSGIEIPGNDKVKVKFQQAMNDEGESFTTDHEDSYKAVYYVEPQKTDHPTYQISRTITVKEDKKASTETVTDTFSQTSSENDSGGSVTEETAEDEEADTENESATESEVESEGTSEVESSQVPETDVDVDGANQITDEEFDAEIESSEDQETMDPETGTTLSDVLTEAVEQDVDLGNLEVGETVTFEMPMLFAATGSQNVSITRGSWYHYADYGLGSYITAPYYVSWNGIKATAYCVQPSKSGPDDGKYSITKLSDGKTLAKVCYYGTKASDENGFFDEKHPDFSTGKRFIITHLAAAYANGSSDWDSGTNATGRSLAKELYNYCVNMPDALVATVVTDADGKAVVKNMPLGKYYVKETQATEGFVLNTILQDAEFTYADQNTPVVFDEVSYTNERQKVAITVEKQDAETADIVAGAVFGIYNAEDIKDRSGKVLVAANTLIQEKTTDAEGQAVCSLDLPLGQYYVKELKAPLGYVSSDEVLTFDASYQGQDVQKIELKSIKKNEPTTVEITKADVTTGVELSGAQLTVTDSEGNVVDRWTSDKDAPHVIKYLHVGETYTLREELAPYGYLVANEIQFTIEDTAEVQKVQMTDEVPIAKLIVNKKGEFLDSVTLVDKVKGFVEHIFNYVTGNLTDVTFEVYAKEDIKAADGVSDDYYKADELVATITTDESGIATLDNLPLGIYYVKEVATAHGYVLDKEPVVVDLSYRDQNTPVVIYDEDWQNHRQTVSINILKKEKDSDRVLEGGIFGLYAKEDIVSASGKVLIEADEVIELKSTDANGEIHFIADLPIDATYYVKELYAPDGFVNAEEVQEFTFEYAGADQALVEQNFIFEDEPTTVEITKSDITTGKEIPGCNLKVVDEDGNVVDEWTSTEEAHVIKELVVGKTYTLIETQPADGYVTAESIEFKIENTAEIQKVEMKDDVTKVEISKQDIAGKELPGAKLTILDSDGKVVESWTSTKDPHYIEMLPIGKYTLREEIAPEGYLVANDVEFEVLDTAEVQHVTMVDELKPTEPDKPSTPKTGDDRNRVIWYGLLALGFGGLGAAFAFKRKKKHD